MGKKYEPVEKQMLRKSNTLVSAKYKASLAENKIMALALTRIEANEKDKNAPLRAQLFPSELKNLIGTPKNIYTTLKKMSKMMTGHSIVLEDGRGNFSAFAMVNNADYIDGVFTIEFNKNLGEHILGLNTEYTPLELSVLVGFKNNAAFRLYELLKSQSYKIRNSLYTEVEYRLSELRFMIGLANADDANVRSAMSEMGKKIDWDKLYEKVDKKQRKYDKWGDFHRYVLIPAQKALEERSNIRFEVEGVKEGRWIKKVRFRIYNNKPENMDIIERKKNIIDSYAKDYKEISEDDYKIFFAEYVGHNKLTKKDLKTFLKVADMDEKRVRNAIALADKQESIINYVGWIRAAIKDEYTEGTETVMGSSELADKSRIAYEKYQKARSIEILDDKMLDIIQEKEDYGDFIYIMELKGYTQKMLETVMSKKEIVDMYYAWKLSEK